MSSSDSSNVSSMMKGHAQYVKGAAEEIVGSLTGSQVWINSAQQDKKAGVDEMRKASENRQVNENQGGMGATAERLAGQAIGCDGMVKEGQLREKS